MVTDVTKKNTGEGVREHREEVREGCVAKLTCEPRSQRGEGAAQWKSEGSDKYKGRKWKFQELQKASEATLV